MATDEETDRDGAESEESPGSGGPNAKLRQALDEFKTDLQERVRGLVRAKKAAEQLCRKRGLKNLDTVEKYTDWLRDADLEAVEMEERRQKAVESLDKFVRTNRRKRRMRFMRSLHGRAEKADVELEKLSDSPLTVFLEPFTVEANFDTEEVELRYAREAVATVDLDPEEVFEARDSAMGRLSERTVDSETFFERAEMAYRLALTSRQAQEGERVDLVDLLAPLALLAAEADSWRDASFEQVDAYPRHLLAHQLHRLRRDGLLTHQGRRLDLGTATGGSTRNKEDVVFIPSGRGEGQYYLSARFTDADE